jgi:hypothetical protein
MILPFSRTLTPGRNIATDLFHSLRHIRCSPLNMNRPAQRQLHYITQATEEIQQHPEASNANGKLHI